MALDPMAWLVKDLLAESKPTIPHRLDLSRTERPKGLTDPFDTTSPRFPLVRIGWVPLAVDRSVWTLHGAEDAEHGDVRVTPYAIAQYAVRRGTNE